MHHDLKSTLSSLIRELVPKHFPSADAQILIPTLERVVFRALDGSSTTDCRARMHGVAAATTTPLVDFFAAQADEALRSEVAHVTAFRAEFATRAADVLVGLRVEYLEGGRGRAPASKYLGGTKAVYEFVRLELGIRMHGAENLHGFALGPGVEDGTIGGKVALIHEAIRDGKMQDVIVDMVKAINSGEL